MFLQCITNELNIPPVYNSRISNLLSILYSSGLYCHIFCNISISLQVSEAGVHRPHVGGIHGRSNDGSYSLVLAGGFEDEVVSYFYS